MQQQQQQQQQQSTAYQAGHMKGAGSTLYFDGPQ
jgi:hypothetical protein